MYKTDEKDFGNLIFILKMCDDIKLYQENEKLVNLLKNRMSLNAILLNLMQIGEYSNKLSKEFIENFDKEYWIQIINLRHRITHDYGGIDLDKIETIIRYNIDGLINKIFVILSIFYKEDFFKELLEDKTFLENFQSKFMINFIKGYKWQ